MTAAAEQIAPIHLVAVEVARAAKKAFDEGRLSAQGPTPTCAYRDRSGLPCAVGAALDDEAARRLDGARDADGDPIDGDIETMARAGLVTADDLIAISLLQGDHDSWAQGAAGVFDGYTNSPTTDERRERFVETLNAILARA